MKVLQSVQVNPKNAILLIVDVQHEFCKPAGKLYNEMSAHIVPGVIHAIQTLAEGARSVGIPVIYIQSVRTLKEPEYTVFGQKPILKLGTWAVEIVEELKPQPGEMVIQKFSHDPFYRPDLDQLLNTLVTDPTRCCAIVTGGLVNICIYHAVMGFHLRNYWTVVPVDSVYYTSDAEYYRALEQFSHPAYPNVFLSRSDLIEFSHYRLQSTPVLKPSEPS